MAVTSVTIALGLAQEMYATKQPNTGKLQADSPVDAAAAANEWFNNQSGIDFANLTVDKDWTPSNPTDLVEVTACGCSIALMSWMVSKGIALADIASVVVVDAYAHLADIYAHTTGDAPGNCWPSFTQAVVNLPQGVQNNDPFGGFGVVFPHAPTIAERIVEAVAADLPDRDKAIADVTTLLTPAPEVI